MPFPKAELAQFFPLKSVRLVTLVGRSQVESGDGAAVFSGPPDAGTVGAAAPRGGKRKREQSEGRGEDISKWTPQDPRPV